nr:hypothetical protein [Tanacetum cinerariifolium]
MNMALALLAKAFKVNTIPTNNNQRSSLIPHNSHIAQPGMNTSHTKMQIIDDNVGNQIIEYMNGLSVVLEIANQYGNRNVVTALAEGNGNDINSNLIRCYNCRGEGHYASNCIVKSRKQDVAYLQQQLQTAQEEEARIQSTQEEFEFMTAADAHEETKRVKGNCTSKDTMQQASTSATQSDNALVYDSNGSTEVLKVKDFYDHDIFNILTQEVRYTDLQTELDRTKQNLETCIIKKEKEYTTLWNNWNSQIPKNQKHMSSECNNITLAIRNSKSEIVCVMCKHYLVTANHYVCVLDYVNDMNSRADNQCDNVSIRENKKKHKAYAKKLKELRSKESLASSMPSKPRTCLRWIPIGRIFAMCGKLTASSNTENKF